MRLFVAVAVPVGAADELDDAVAPLRQSCPGLRWTVRDAWHLTLAFLGEVTEPAWARLGPQLELAAAGRPRLSLSLGGAGAFPGAARARVLWTGVKGELAELGTLARCVADGARQAGVPPAEERRRFQPHLTLARCREPVDVQPLVHRLSGYAGTPWTAGEIYLIRSHLPGGRPHDRPRYETLGCWPLTGSPGPGTGLPRA
jgi:RNA 2',3'-cyclic 3'-phosphodiesterase